MTTYAIPAFVVSIYSMIFGFTFGIFMMRIYSRLLLGEPDKIEKPKYIPVVTAIENIFGGIWHYVGIALFLIWMIPANAEDPLITLIGIQDGPWKMSLISVVLVAALFYSALEQLTIACGRRLGRSATNLIHKQFPPRQFHYDT